MHIAKITHLEIQITIGKDRGKTIDEACMYVERAQSV